MIYLIYSNSFNIINEEIDKIFSSKDDVEVINYNNTNLEEIINIASYTSLFSDEKKMIIKNATFFSNIKDNKQELLEKYLEDPNPLTTIIFTCMDKIDERKKITKIIKEKYKLIINKNLSPKEISQRLINNALANKYKLNMEDANYITSMSLNNYDIALNELKKICIYYNKAQEIKKEDIKEIISTTIDDNNFRFVDYVIMNKYDKAIKLLNNFKLLHIEPVALISLLAREYRNMLYVKKLQQNNYTNSAIMKELNLQDWQLNKTITNSYNMSLDFLEDKLTKLTELDYTIKTSKMDKYLALEMFILKG